MNLSVFAKYHTRATYPPLYFRCSSVLILCAIEFKSIDEYDSELTTVTIITGAYLCVNINERVVVLVGVVDSQEYFKGDTANLI